MPVCLQACDPKLERRGGGEGGREAGEIEPSGFLFSAIWIYWIDIGPGRDRESGEQAGNGPGLDSNPSP